MCRRGNPVRGRSCAMSRRCDGLVEGFSGEMLADQVVRHR